GLADRHAVEDQLQLAAGRLVVVAMEPDRGLPDALDEVEDVGALLVAHGVAEDAAQEADVVSQPRVFLQRVSFLSPFGADFGIGRHGLGRHLGSTPEAARLMEECASFLPQCKMKM